jgi:hypothetical protein
MKTNRKQKTFKIIYTTPYQRIVAKLLLISFSLTNCGGLANSIKNVKSLESQKEKNQIQIPKILNQTPTLSSDKKYKIQFLKNNQIYNQSQAILIHNLPKSFTKKEIVKVISLDKKHSIENILNFKDKKIRERKIHVNYNPLTKEYIITLGIKGKGGMLSPSNDPFLQTYLKDKEQLERAINTEIESFNHVLRNIKNRTKEFHLSRLLKISIEQNEKEVIEPRYP